jgi:hypothetical protein
MLARLLNLVELRVIHLNEFKDEILLANLVSCPSLPKMRALMADGQHMLPGYAKGTQFKT